MLAVKPGGLYVDGTVGLGGHAAAILDAERSRRAASSPSIATPRRWRARARRLAAYGDRVRFVHADFREIPARARRRVGADGILLDLGRELGRSSTTPSAGSASRPTARSTCGWTARRGRPPPTSSTSMDEEDLADVIYRYGEDRASRRIARAIVSARRKQRIETTAELAAIVRRASGRPSWKPGHRSRDADLPGPAHPREPRARPAVGDDARARRPASPRAAGWPSSPSTAWRTARSSTPSAPSAPRGFEVLAKKPVRPSRRGGGAQPALAQRAAARPAAAGGGVRTPALDPAIMVPKAIDNSQVVREVDPRSSRDLWWLVAVVATLVVGLVLYAWPHLQVRQVDSERVPHVPRARAAGRGEPQAAPREGQPGEPEAAWSRSRCATSASARRPRRASSSWSARPRCRPERALATGPVRRPRRRRQ